MVSPIMKALSRAITPPGMGATPDFPTPSLPAPASQPTTKPAKRGMQQSFLSGVAGSALQGGGGTGGGHTLLGQ